MSKPYSTVLKDSYLGTGSNFLKISFSPKMEILCFVLWRQYSTQYSTDVCSFDRLDWLTTPTQLVLIILEVISITFFGFDSLHHKLVNYFIWNDASLAIVGSSLPCQMYTSITWIQNFALLVLVVALPTKALSPNKLRITKSQSHHIVVLWGDDIES